MELYVYLLSIFTYSVSLISIIIGIFSINFEISFSEKEIKDVDFVLLFLGENAYAESPGNINDLTLDENQIILAKKAIELNKKVILVLVQGRPRIISSFSDDIDGIITDYPTHFNIKYKYNKLININPYLKFGSTLDLIYSNKIITNRNIFKGTSSEEILKSIGELKRTSTSSSEESNAGERFTSLFNKLEEYETLYTDYSSKLKPQK